MYTTHVCKCQGSKDLYLSFTFLPLKLRSILASDAISTAESLVTRQCRCADTAARPPHYRYHARGPHKPLRHIFIENGQQATRHCQNRVLAIRTTFNGCCQIRQRSVFDVMQLIMWKWWRDSEDNRRTKFKWWCTAGGAARWRSWDHHSAVSMEY